MTDLEVFNRFITKYGHRFPDFSDNYWDNLNNGILWYKKHIPSGTYAEVMERYHRAIIEIVSIEEQMRRGGFDD